MRPRAGRLVEIGLKATTNGTVVICLPMDVAPDLPADSEGTCSAPSSSTLGLIVALSRHAYSSMAGSPVLGRHGQALTSHRILVTGHMTTLGWLVLAGEERRSRARPGMSYWAAV
jgi:hypothetical protein